MKHALALIAAAALAVSAFGADAAPCKDAKGKFMKCPPAATAKAVRAAPCRDASGAFAKCGTPGARAPALAKAATPKGPTAH